LAAKVDFAAGQPALLDCSFTKGFFEPPLLILYSLVCFMLDSLYNFYASLSYN